MPLLQRVIEPVHVSRGTLPLDEQGTLAIDVPNELECVTNGVLANVIRQLSSLSKHAENMFGALLKEAKDLVTRADSLQGRIDRLSVNVTQLDSNGEEVSLQDIHMRKAYKSTVVYDQEVVCRSSMPTAMLKTYELCDKPPPLDKLNPYREDGKDGLKFYTDPKYFFELWKQQMLKDTEKIMHDKGKKLALAREGAEPHRPKPEGKRVKKVRQPPNSRDRYRQMIPSHELMEKGGNYINQHGVVTRNDHSHELMDSQMNHGHPVRPNSLELHSSYLAGQEPAYPGSPGHYPPAPPPAYSEYPQSPHSVYPPPPPYSPSVSEQLSSTSGTPTRHGRVNVRPSQPPPAPPVGSSNSSSTSTPNASATGTPSSGVGRYHRGSNHSRDNLPPPPPPPEGVSINGVLANSFAAQKTIQATPPNVHQNLTPTHYSHHMANHYPPSESAMAGSNAPECADLPPPPPSPDKDAMHHHQAEHLPPSPPPPPPLPSVNGASGQLPPPPPPLPPSELHNGPVNNIDASGIGARVAEVASLSSETASTASSVSKTSDAADPKSKLQITGHSDARSDLLAAIREGFKLRRVQDSKQKEVEKAAPLHDVASILARRVAMEFSDSESESESEYGSDGWDDESEC